MGCGIWLAASGWVNASSGAGGHAAPAVPSPEQALREIILGNDSFQQAHSSEYFEPYQKSQSPALVVVGCSDSRVQTPLLGIDPHNRAFIIRNIGNQVDTCAGSVAYGVQHLPSSVLLILGHSSCGAVKAAMGDYSHEPESIRAELEPLKTPLSLDSKQGTEDERWARNVERNVDYQVFLAKQTYADSMKSKHLMVVGAVYDFNNVYGKGRGNLIITNINGESNPDKIASNPLLAGWSAEERSRHTGSLAPDTSF